MKLMCKKCGISFDYDEDCQDYKEQANLVNSFLDGDRITEELHETWKDGFLCASCAIDSEMKRKERFEKQKATHGYSRMCDIVQ